jgi:hypothetical protein
MTGDQPRKDVVAAARTVPDRDGDPLALVELFDRLRLRGLRRECDQGDDNSA